MEPNSSSRGPSKRSNLYFDHNDGPFDRRNFRLSLPSSRVSGEQDIKALKAAQRALPIQRLCGNGMDFADAVHLHEMANLLIPWVDASCAIGRANRRKAEQAEADGNITTAVARYQYSAAAYRFAQSPLMSDTAEKILIYKQALSAFSQAARLLPKQYEKVGIEFGDNAMTGWLIRKPSIDNPPSQSIVIIFGGADGWREEYHQGAMRILDRGVSVFLLDLPGQGETRLLNRLFLRPKVEAAIGAVINWLRHYAGSRKCRALGQQLGWLFCREGGCNSTWRERMLREQWCFRSYGDYR